MLTSLPAVGLIDPVAVALAEGVGAGDLTSRFFIPETHQSRARILAKQTAIVAGTGPAKSTFQQVDGDLMVEITASDGASVHPGDTVLLISGRTRSILTGERVALNFLQRLSGIATLTRAFVEAVKGTGAQILDTRKTTPGLRRLEKEAVAAGGGTKHPIGRFSSVIGDGNHFLATTHLAGGVPNTHKKQPRPLFRI